MEKNTSPSAFNEESYVEEEVKETVHVLINDLSKTLYKTEKCLGLKGDEGNYTVDNSYIINIRATSCLVN
jgi:hypothetical protein